MSENKDIHEEEQKATPENPEAEESITSENLAEEKSKDDLLAEEKDCYIRLYAEFENYKKRTSKEKLEFFQYANQDLMISLLGVLDDFERAMKEIEKNGNEADFKGIELIYNKLKSKLMEKGMKPIEVNKGDDFNVDIHEAITQIPAPEDDLKGKVIDIVETGYMLHDRVIRFAKVITGN